MHRSVAPCSISQAQSDSLNPYTLSLEPRSTGPSSYFVTASLRAFFNQCLGQAMIAPTTIKARVYGMEWDTRTMSSYPPTHPPGSLEPSLVPLMHTVAGPWHAGHLLRYFGRGQQMAARLCMMQLTPDTPLLQVTSYSELSHWALLCLLIVHQRLLAVHRTSSRCRWCYIAAEYSATRTRSARPLSYTHTPTSPALPAVRHSIDA